jgi:LPXTG-site transpeptidase (sortase) family protein
MALHLRAAGWVRPHSAAVRRPRRGALALTAGAVSLVAGAVVLMATLAPLLGIAGETATIGGSVVQPISALGSSTVRSHPDALSTSSGFASGVITDGPVNGVAFELTIPRLGYRATVLEGVGKEVLDRAPGHYPDSAWPGRSGNVGVAAHNVYWLSFNRLTARDRVEIRTQHGLYVYAITGSKVVSPTDRTVLAQTPEHRLTLTTCYPLWAGAFATQRLVFFACEIGGVG